MTTAARFRKDSGRVTLIETIMFPLYLSLIYSCVRWAVHRYGWRGGIGRFILVFVVLPLVPFALGLLVSAVYSGMPSYPACRTGKCRSSDYHRRTLEKVVMLSSAVAERPTESAAAAFMKSSPTVPSAPTWSGEHSVAGFPMLRHG